MDFFGELTGYLAATLATLTFLPQALKTFRTRDSKSLSTATLTLSFLGNLCWLINGLAYQNMALIFSGLFIMILLLPLFWVKYQNNEISLFLKSPKLPEKFSALHSKNTVTID